MRGKNILWITIAAMLLAALAPGIAFAQDTEVYIDPYNSVATVGNYFSVDVKIRGAVDVYAWEFKIKYGQLQYRVAFAGVIEGDFLKEEGIGTYITWTWNTFKETCMVGGTRLGDVEGKSGDGTLATVIFSVVRTGGVTLDLYDVILVHADGTTYTPTLVGDAVVYNVVPPIPAGAIIWIAPKEGGKVWPDWPRGYPGDTQRLYARIRNTGTDAVWVTVKFIVSGAMDEVVWPRLDADSPAIARGELLPAATFDEFGNLIAKGSVEVASHTFDVPDSGYYYVKAIAYLSAVGPLGPWTMWDSSMGGEGISRDIGTCNFWTKP